MPSLFVCENPRISSASWGERVGCDSGWIEIDATQTQLLVSGGFDQAAFELGFEGVLLLWVAGLGIGLVVSQIRKLNKR